MPRIIGIPKVRFNLASPTGTDETYILILFQLKWDRFKMATGIKVKPDDWDKKRQRVRPAKRFDQSHGQNALLQKMEDACKEIYLENGGGQISADAFREALLIQIGDQNQPEQRPPTFVEFVEDYYQERKRQPNANKNTLKVIHKVKVHVQEYARDRKRKLQFSELNEKMYSDLRDWLHAAPRNLSTNYVQKIFQYIKLFARKAEIRGYHSNQAHRELRLPKTPVSKITLSFGQLEALHALDLTDTPRLAKVRDLFLIGAYTGLRFSDFSRIRPEHIQETNGQRFIEMTTQKTDQVVYIPLLPILENVLEKYGYKSPTLTNQRMNAGLKELGQVAGFNTEVIVNDATGGIRREKKKRVWEMLTTHVARRSFATNFYKNYPHLINNIMQITGHTTERQFRTYIVTDALDSAAAFSKAITGK